MADPNDPDARNPRPFETPVEPDAPPRGPALFDLDADEAPGLSAHAAPPPPDLDGPAPDPAALRALRLGARRGSGLSRLFWGAALSLMSLALGVAAWDFAANLIARNAVIGAVAAALAAAVGLALVLFALREAAALARLGRVESLRAQIDAAVRGADRPAAVKAVGRLRALYDGRPDMEWGLAELKAREGDLIDAHSLLLHAENALMRPLDAAAEAEVARVARQVALTTAVIPMALIDVLAALTLNLRMIRTVAQIYGGRAGWLGSMRLMRAVAAHLLATGAVALGDDMVGAALGGGMAAKLSRRFGEGLVNGALTARVGAAAIDVCRPMPFAALPRPRGRVLAARALKGVFNG
jgi:putative membrane protein